MVITSKIVIKMIFFIDNLFFFRLLKLSCSFLICPLLYILFKKISILNLTRKNLARRVLSITGKCKTLSYDVNKPAVATAGLCFLLYLYYLLYKQLSFVPSKPHTVNTFIRVSQTLLEVLFASLIERPSC